mgnify:CR=1 FL=1
MPRKQAGRQERSLPEGISGKLIIKFEDIVRHMKLSPGLIVRGVVRFDIYNRCAVEGIQSADSQRVALSFDQSNCR